MTLKAFGSQESYVQLVSNTTALSLAGSLSARLGNSDRLVTGLSSPTDHAAGSRGSNNGRR